jgi:hypothetical protein
MPVFHQSNSNIYLPSLFGLGQTNQLNTI